MNFISSEQQKIHEAMNSSAKNKALRNKPMAWDRAIARWVLLQTYQV